MENSFLERSFYVFLSQWVIIMPTAIKLPPPQIDLDFPLMNALEKRRSVRKWGTNSLSEQELSNLL
jgi:hypothetical protein